MRTTALLAVALAMFSVTSVAARSPQVEAEYALARGAEATGDWDGALLHYETIYDSMVVAQTERVELRRKFAELRPKVEPNTDPAKAGTYRVRVYVFRTLEMKGERDGKPFGILNTYTDEQIEALRRATAAFAQAVWEHTLGALRIDWDLVVVEQPLTKVDGWPDPANCVPRFPDFVPGVFDCVMVYANTTDVEPWALWGGTFGSIPEVGGAAYIGFNDNDAGLSQDPSGEVQVHEWLHAAQWALEAIDGYPAGLMASSDCGGKCSGIDGVACWEKRPDDPPGWMALYHHLLDLHATRRMWRELSLVHPVPNAWAALFCRRFLVLGPFGAAGDEAHGLEMTWFDEAAVVPAVGTETAGRTWQEITPASRTLDLSAELGPHDDSVAYVAVTVRSARDLQAEARLGSDDSCKLWQEGSLLLNEPALRAVEVDQNTVPVVLRAGDNHFLLKVANAGGGWAAVFRVCDADGAPLSDVEYVVTGE